LLPAIAYVIVIYYLCLDINSGVGWYQIEKHHRIFKKQEEGLMNLVVSSVMSG